MKLLRAVAFLPQGIHRRDLDGILKDSSAISIAESLCRCSLAYWRDDRLVILSPICMHIMEKYSQDLLYNDELVESIRQHYYPQIFREAERYSKEEHVNLNRVFLFDLAQNVVEAQALWYLCSFTSYLYSHNPQSMSLWPSLACAQSEVELNAFNQAKADAMVWMSRLYGKMYHNRTSLEMIDAAEQFCRYTDGLKAKLADGLCVKGDNHQSLGKIADAETCLQEAHSICQELGDAQEEAFVSINLSDCAMRRGDLSKATALLDLAERHFDPTYQAWTDILLKRAQVALLQGNFDQARNGITCAMESDEEYHGGRKRLEIVHQKANVEAKASTTQAAETVLAEGTTTEILPGQPNFMQFLTSLRGQAYFAGIVEDIDSSRNHAARVLLLASEERSDESYRRSLLISGYIEMFARKYSKARDFLHSALTAIDAENLGITVMAYRALGEVAALEKDTEGAE